MEVLSRPVEDRLRQALAGRTSTLLAVGPVSKNTVDAVIELAYEHPAPLMLIASRRQVDAAKFGGGYVNNWNTESFADYVRQHDPERRVILARDHGGPWQSIAEVTQQLNLNEAMASAKQSYEVDITAGFDILHLDPSIDIHNTHVSPSAVLERLFELYEHCIGVTREQGKELIFEVGTEEQSGLQQEVKDVRSFLQSIEQFCSAQNFPKPFFVVLQTGTKVKETRNVGLLQAALHDNEVDKSQVQIAKLVRLCQEFNVHLKEHNTDYLSDETLAWHPRAGIHATNVAPEFGVVETRQLLRVCQELKLNQEHDDFLRLAYDSGKWGKWLTYNSTSTDYDKAVIAGHYVFSHPEFLSVKKRIAARCAAQGFELDRVLRHAVKHAIRRYMLAFNLLN